MTATEKEFERMKGNLSELEKIIPKIDDMILANRAKFILRCCTEDLAKIEKSHEFYEKSYGSGGSVWD